jgi:uncharacterized delta-60 repeat protein
MIRHVLQPTVPTSQEVIMKLLKAKQRLFFPLATAIVALGLALTDGALDTSFDSDGKVTTPIGTGDDGGRAMALQADGKIVVGGYTDAGVSTHWDFALVRYNTDGSLDNTFGVNGKVVTPMGAGDDAIAAILIQSDGKIVAAGDADTTSLGSGVFVIALARYDDTGALDATFGTGGKVFTAIGTVNDRGDAAALQSDGKIVVAGRYTNGPSDESAYRDIAVIRYGTSGTLDAGFGSGGIVTTQIGSDADEANAVIIQPDGKILVSGFTNNGSNDDIALIRYNDDGTLDSGFGTGGIVTTAIGSGEEGGLQIRMQTDDKIVMAAYSDVGGGDLDWAVLRYGSTGSLDGTFGTSGITVTSFGTGFDAPLQCLISSDGKILLAGWGSNGSDLDFALARYTSSGALDATFGSGGKLVTPIGPGDDFGFGMAMQSDGKIVLAGESNNGTNADFAVVRYVNAAPLAVQLESLTASAAQQSVLLQWNTATEMNNYGFEIERQSEISKTWEKVGFVAGTGTSNSLHEYSFVDEKVTPGHYVYRIKQVDKDGSFKYAKEVQVEVGLAPKVFTLGQNYPNPFNPSTVIEFTVAENGPATLKVFDIRGREVATLFHGDAETGKYYQATFDAKSLASGLYFSVLQADGKQLVKKMVLMK